MSEQSNKLLSFLESILGYSKQYSNDEYYFECPFCVKKDNKKKLAVCLDENNPRYENWQCWRCSTSGGSIYKLLTELKSNKSDVDRYLSISKNKHKHYDISKIDKYINKKKVELFDTTQKNIIHLPDGFVPLYGDLIVKDYDVLYKKAISYIIKRRLTQYDIEKYRIGYCGAVGEYYGYLIIPSFDMDLDINFFVARNFLSDNMKYKMPSVSKNIIFNEPFIQWNYPVILVEGVFDYFAVKRNAIPLLGKTLSEKLKNKLLMEKPDVYVCLDNDALKNSISIMEELINNGLNVYFVHLDKKDPSEIGFDGMMNRLDTAQKINLYDFIKLKMETKVEKNIFKELNKKNNSFF